MATVITITIPDAAAGRIVDAFAAEFNWNSGMGVTKAQFAKQQIIEFAKQVTRNYEGNIEASEARANVESEINGINIT